MPRRSIAQIQEDRFNATTTLAKLYARWFASEEDKELELSIEATESKFRNQYPQDFKKIERNATNLALGHREA